MRYLRATMPRAASSAGIFAYTKRSHVTLTVVLVGKLTPGRSVGCSAYILTNQLTRLSVTECHRIFHMGISDETNFSMLLKCDRPGGT